MDASGKPDNTHQEKADTLDSHAVENERAPNHTDDKAAASERMALAKRMFTRSIAIIRNCFWRTVCGLKAIDGLITGIATVIVAVATVFLYWATQALVEDAKKTSEASSRAWIVPTGASFFETPIADYPRIRIDITNVGKEPALEVQQANDLSFTDKYEKNQSGGPYIDPDNIKWPAQISCDRNQKLALIGPIYPSENTYYIRQGFTDGHFKELQKRERILIVFGCFLYKDTFGKGRQSPYCFYTVPNAKAFKDWTFAPCLKRTEEPK